MFCMFLIPVGLGGRLLSGLRQGGLTVFTLRLGELGGLCPLLPTEVKADLPEEYGENLGLFILSSPGPPELRLA